MKMNSNTLIAFTVGVAVGWWVVPRLRGSLAVGTAIKGGVG